MTEADLTAIDPVGCGCVECLTGEYVPLDIAGDDAIVAYLVGSLDNHTGAEFHLEAADTTLTVTHPDTHRVWHISRNALQGANALRDARLAAAVEQPISFT